LSRDRRNRKPEEESAARQKREVHYRFHAGKHHHRDMVGACGKPRPLTIDPAFRVFATPDDVRELED